MNGYKINGYNFIATLFPKGYYLAIGFVEVTPSASSGHLYYGVSKYDYWNSNANGQPYTRYYQFTSTQKLQHDFQFYVTNPTQNQEYCFFIYHSVTLTVNSSKCQMIHIA